MATPAVMPKAASRLTTYQKQEADNKNGSEESIFEPCKPQNGIEEGSTGQLQKALLDPQNAIMQ